MISAPRGTRRPRSATMQSLRSRIMRFGVGNMALLMLTLDPHTADVVRSAGPFAGSWSPPIAISHQSLRVRFIFPEPPVKRCSRDPKAAGRRADIMSVLFKRLPDHVIPFVVQRRNATSAVGWQDRIGLVAEMFRQMFKPNHSVVMR